MEPPSLSPVLPFANDSCLLARIQSKRSLTFHCSTQSLLQIHRVLLFLKLNLVSIHRAALGAIEFLQRDFASSFLLSQPLHQNFHRFEKADERQINWDKSLLL